MLFSKLLKLLLGTSSLCDFEDIEPDSLAEGTTLSHGDDVPNLDIPAKTPLVFQRFCVSCICSPFALQRRHLPRAMLPRNTALKETSGV